MLWRGGEVMTGQGGLIVEDATFKARDHRPDDTAPGAVSKGPLTGARAGLRGRAARAGR